MVLQVVGEAESPDLEEIYRETTQRVAPPRDPEALSSRPIIKREAPTKEAMMALQAVASLLTVRLALVLAVIGAFILGTITIQGGSQVGIYVLGLFVLIIGCLSWLAQKRVS